MVATGLYLPNLLLYAVDGFMDFDGLNFGNVSKALIISACSFAAVLSWFALLDSSDMNSGNFKLGLLE